MLTTLKTEEKIGVMLSDYDSRPPVLYTFLTMTKAHDFYHELKKKGRRVQWLGEMQIKEAE